MTQPLGPSGLTGYDFTRIKAFGQNYFIANPSNTPSDGDVIVYDSVDGIVWGQLDLDEYIPKPTGPVAGDYLRYNSAGFWVASGPDIPYLSQFSAYNSGTQSVTTTTDISFSNQNVIDTDIYSHTVSTATITVLSAGKNFF